MRKKLSLLVACLMSVACGDDSTLPVLDASASDTSNADAGPISFDAGPTPDAASDSGRDAAGDAGADASADAGSDAGDDAGPGTCLFSLEDGLSDGCFPACVEGSRDATIGCTTYECLLETLQMGDGTGLMFDTGIPADNVFYRDYLRRVVEATESCHQCETLGTRACEFQLCPDESTAFFNCLRGLTGEANCVARSNAVFNCASSPANDGTFRTCYAQTLNRCLQ